MLAANAPGLILSIWLNTTAIKLQFHNTTSSVQANTCLHDESRGHTSDNSIRSNHTLNENTDMRSDETLAESIASSHEEMLLSILTLWITVLIVVGFGSISTDLKVGLVGIVVNMNLVIFYGAPLSSIMLVLKTKNSSSIHLRTLGELIILNINIYSNIWKGHFNQLIC